MDFPDYHYDLSCRLPQKRTNSTTKGGKIWSEFYLTDTMTNQDWMSTKYNLKHITTFMAVHGFNHKIVHKRAITLQIKTMHVKNTL
jgi:hypothetical protein